MTHREYVEWLHYAEKNQLPSRRIELLLAQIPQYVIGAAGGKAGAIGDYMPYKAQAEDDVWVSEFGFNPVN